MIHLAILAYLTVVLNGHTCDYKYYFIKYSTYRAIPFYTFVEANARHLCNSVYVMHTKDYASVICSIK